MKSWQGIPVPSWFAAGGAIIFCAVMLITMNPYWGIGLLVCGAIFWACNIADLVERENRWKS